MIIRDITNSFYRMLIKILYNQSDILTYAQTMLTLVSLIILNRKVNAIVIITKKEQ